MVTAPVSPADQSKAAISNTQGAVAPGRLRHSWSPDTTGQTDGVGHACPSETPRVESIPKRDAISTVLIQPKGLRVGLGPGHVWGSLRRLTSVPLTSGQSCRAAVTGSSVGTGNRRYGLMFRSGHLGASLRRPRGPRGKGLSPWGGAQGCSLS